MAKIAAADAQTVESMEGFEGRYQELLDYTVGFETYTEHADMAALFKGLPDDRCQCPHWGYVITGKLVYHYADGDDTIVAGEAYYAPPGHTPEIFPDTRIVEFSPTDRLNQTMEVVLRNVEG